ncbi:MULTISPECIES: ferrous iron transport protein B [unclassified Oceanispirochaeta]|uniref:ferrous iron transport protein B n=1 Tax=unclassified Oceanispirochaeta TaxID=2635722 RepID=UPI000E097561|nr:MULTISPECIES: ferrous iron transport protein B [unclassified Oceanispirochaeta]MBF9017267.1 ferrous iron transport protein B [Oceanispirochaeta sp. M2]NPD75368.1 ferrous iron transport protein B [Oceanispirochaeta sp. M1]RDG28772.1 ferrous iron transport protein B [Oceanispirochaeta sp. M1]
MKIALAGNPNSGKTTLFNAITGKIEHVGNWPGVTVEKKEGSVKSSFISDEKNVTVVDLPGAYSMSPYTSEESITKDFVINEKPDVIINIVDAGNISRSLFFTTQLLELGVPVIVALNKCDINEKKGTIIDTMLLSEVLKCPVIETIATESRQNGLASLIDIAVSVNKNGDKQKAPSPKDKIIEFSKEEIEALDKKRYDRVSGIVTQVERRKLESSSQTRQDKVDRFVAHKWLGIPIFAVIIWLVFSVSQSWVGPWLADVLVGWIDGFYGLVEGALGEGTNPVLSSLLLDGIIGGVGAVVGFLPLIMVLFFMLALLEDSGYMSRVALIMDRYFKKIGLSGKSIIPMIISTGCAIPGIMATRTIKNERQRRTTAMLAPFMPCGAKLPIIALFAGIFFNNNAWVGTSMYFLAILMIIVSGLVIRLITGDKSTSYFLIELPEYRIPSIKRATISMFSRAKAFIIKAGTIILICNAVVQILQTFNWQLQVVTEEMPGSSILASIASPLAWIFIPLGFGLWQFAAAAITGFIAKENVVGTLAVTFSITNFINVEELALVAGGSEVVSVFGIGAVAALSYLVFNLFTPPCFAAIGSMNSEMESRKWLWGAIGFQLGMGYIVAFLVYQLGTLFTMGELGSGFLGGLMAVVAIIGFIVYLILRNNRSEIKSSLKAA